MVPVVTPQLVANSGARALRLAITDPERFACEPKVDDARGLLVYQPDGSLEMRNRHGERRDWLRGDAYEAGLRRLADRLPILWQGTVLDGELVAGRIRGTMAALYGSKEHRARLRFVVLDVPVVAGVDLRPLSWEERRERPELLAHAFDVPLELSPLVAPSSGLVEQMTDGRLEGIVLKDRTAPYRAARGSAGTRSRIEAGTSARRGGSTGAKAAWKSEEKSA